MPKVSDVYPMWKFYPSAVEPPEWVSPVVAAFAAVRSQIDSRLSLGVRSDAALAALRPELVRYGFEIEDGKTRAGTIRRPVLSARSVGRSWPTRSMVSIRSTRSFWRSRPAVARPTTPTTAI